MRALTVRQPWAWAIRRWVRRRRPADAGTVAVELTMDASAFETAMLEAAEGLSRNRYRQRIRHERSLGQAYVGVQLDQLCRDFGFDPVQTWRLPRMYEQRWKRDLAEWTAQQRAALSVLTANPDPMSVIKGTGA